MPLPVALPLSFSVLDAALTVPAVAKETGDPMTEGDCEAGGEGSCFDEFLEGAIAAMFRDNLSKVYRGL